MSRLWWTESVQRWNEGDHLAPAAAAAGFDLGADPQNRMLTG
jgi:hypothetical protein